MRVSRWLLFVFCCSVLVPAAALAQEDASLTGVVKDSSGAVLPGVTVEAASPVLIEKTREAVSDGSGQYRIVGLRPGTYTVTFTLTGFSSVKREGIEVSGRAVYTVNAEMKIGSLQETITVTGETPIVDVQSVKRQTTISNETMNAIPTSKGYAGVMVLMPAIITQSGASADVQVTPGMVVFGGAGGRSNEGRMQVDGLNTGASLNGGGVSGYNADLTNATEVVTTNSGGLGEAEVGGPSISIVPRTGGNTFKGTAYAAGLGSGMVSSNYTDALKAAGLASPLSIQKLWDVTAGIGGPIKKDRIWFFANYRDEGSWTTIPGIFANANFNNITAPASNATTPWNYVADTSRPAYNANSWTIGSGRVTAQLSQRNKLGIFWDEQHPCNGSTYTANDDGCRKPSNNQVFDYVFGSPSSTSPEAGGYANRFQRVQQATWSSPVTNKLLLEAGVGTYLSRWGTNQQPGNVTNDLVRVTEGCNTAAGCGASPGAFPGLMYRSEAPFDDWIGQHNWRASASYVTGAHVAKFGYQGGFHVDDEKNFPNSTYTTYTLQDASANNSQVSINETLTPFQVSQRVRYDAFYAQDQWTHGRFTLQGAVRYDHSWSYFNDEQVGPVRFLTAPVVFASNDPLLTTPSTLLCSSDLKGGNLPAGFNGTCVNNITGYKDITPRGGVAWDVFGTGKTAVKISVGKYLEAASSGNGNYTAGNPTARMITSTTRTWTDTNNNFAPDCSLENPAAQDNRATGGDFCGALTNGNFGKPIFGNSFDSTNMGGWGVRPNDWGVVASVQQQLLARTSVEISYSRRWLNNFTATDNILAAAADYAQFSVTAPTDPRLPGGGGYPISGLYNINPTLSTGFASNVSNNFNTNASNYGNQYSHYNGVLVNISSRVHDGLTLQGGFNTGKTVTDDCEIRALVPELTVTGGVSPTSPYCHNDPGLVTRVTGLGSYLIPKVDVLFSATFRSDQGGVLAANYNVPNAAIVPSLGRSLSNNATFATVNLVAPGQVWGDRVNELDFKIGKILKFGGTRTNVGIEIYNALNESSVLTYVQTYNPAIQSGTGAWLQPQTIMTPRFLKFSVQFDF